MHDKNGKPLKVGDKILVAAVITAIAAVDDFCNVTATIGGDADHGPNNITSTVSLNAKQTELIESEVVGGEAGTLSDPEALSGGEEPAIHDTPEPASLSDVSEPESAPVAEEPAAESGLPDDLGLPETLTEASEESSQDQGATSQADNLADDGSSPENPREDGSYGTPREEDAPPTPSADTQAASGGNF